MAAPVCQFQNQLSSSNGAAAHAHSHDGGHGHSHDHAQEHGHTHEHLDHAGELESLAATCEEELTRFL
jgi:urease accessory protein